MLLSMSLLPLGSLPLPHLTFFSNATAPTEIYTLSLHDALPILQEGIGDTIRVSLTPAPNGDRSEEVVVAQQILQSLGIRSFTPQVTACPGCGRTTSTLFQEMADDIGKYLRAQLPVWRGRFKGVEEMKVAVKGCGF